MVAKAHYETSPRVETNAFRQPVSPRSCGRGVSGQDLNSGLKKLATRAVVVVAVVGVGRRVAAGAVGVISEGQSSASSSLNKFFDWTALENCGLKSGTGDAGATDAKS
jgi:hypothetical protein